MPACTLQSTLINESSGPDGSVWVLKGSKEMEDGLKLAHLSRVTSCYCTTPTSKVPVTPKRPRRRSLVTLALLTGCLWLISPLASAADLWVTYEGKSGPGRGKHIVFVSGDEEYRSEEALPQLAKILAKHHGFTCTVHHFEPKVGGTFKIAAVPFHYWTPDAYQGAPTPITGFLSVGPKLGAFALLIRVFAEALGPLRADWLGVFLVLTVLTMTVGNVVALTQVNVKRMLAYSSIAHTGYIMAGLAAFAATDDPAIAAQGIESILFYLLGYGVMNIAAFAVVGMLQRDTRRYGGLSSFAGLASRAPLRAAAMAILMLSLTGIPPTVGFFAKLYVLLAAVAAGLEWLAVIIVLNAALAAFYYLRVVVYMYMRDPEADPAPLDTSPFGSFALTIAVVGVLILGLFPDPILNLLEVSAASLF